MKLPKYNVIVLFVVCLAFIIPTAVSASPQTILLVSGSNTQSAGYTSIQPSNPLDISSYSKGGWFSAVATSWDTWYSATQSPFGSGAMWVSSAASTEGGIEDQWRLFKIDFDIPEGSTVTSAQLWYTADNTVAVYLNDVEISNTGLVYGPAPEPNPYIFQNSYSVNFIPQVGPNTLKFVVRNWIGDVTYNPTGLLYKGVIEYENQPPVADFEATPTSGSTPLKVTFTDKSTGDGITSRVWQFKLNSESEWTTFTFNKKSSYKFIDDGIYDVKLTVTGTGGSDEELKSNLLKIGCDFSTQPGIERCFGGIGNQCDGIFGVPFKKNENTCLVKGYMSVGSILHDNCCIDSGNTGVRCANPTPGTTKCLPEWMLAFDDVANDRTWKATFGPYPAGNKGDNLNLAFQMVPSGAHVDPNYQSYCPSGSCRVDKKGNTIIKGSGAGQYCVCQ